MTFFANLLLVAAGLLVLALGRLQLSAMPGGDRGVGHAWALLVGHGALIVTLLAATGVVGATGRLVDLPVAAGWRVGVAIIFVAVSAGVAAAAAIAAPAGKPAPWSFAAALRVAPLLVPLLLILCAALLLNAGADAARDPAVPQLLTVVTVLTVVTATIGAAPSLARRVAAFSKAAARDPAALDENERWILAEIERHEADRYFTSLLGYTRAGNHPTIRSRALGRIQSLPDWEQRLRDALATASAPEAFTFLDANDVPNPASFAPAVGEGIRQQALQVRERIRRASHSSHLYEGLMIVEVEKVLHTVEKLERHGTDYVPAMRELRAAFSEPTDFTHPAYRAVKAIDRWLAKRR